MSEIDEETIARAIAPEAWADDLPIPTRGDVLEFHARRQESCRKARAVLALVLPAIERARVEERERAAELAESISQAQAAGWYQNPSPSGCGGGIAASNTGFFIAAAIRKG